MTTTTRSGDRERATNRSINPSAVNPLPVKTTSTPAGQSPRETRLPPRPSKTTTTRAPLKSYNCVIAATNSARARSSPRLSAARSDGQAWTTL